MLCPPDTHSLCAVARGRRDTTTTTSLILRNPPSWRRLDSAGETINAEGTTTNREKQSTHKFNEIRQRAYILGPREREILLIQQSIQLLKEETLEGGKGFLVLLSVIQYMRPQASIYSHRVPEFTETQVGFNPNQKRNSNSKRKLQPRLSVDRPVDRPMPRSTGPVDHAFPRANPPQSVDRGRSTAPTCARPCTSVDRGWSTAPTCARPCTPVDRAGRPASSTGRPVEEACLALLPVDLPVD